MARLITLRSIRMVSPAGADDRARARLYKDDYPRRIDRYIDFFGGGLAHRGAPTAGARLALRSLA